MSQHRQLAQLLIEVEREMRALDLWQASAPSAEALSSAQPFCVDTLSFCEWVQWIMIPRFCIMIEQRQPLPASSDIASMAEEVFKEVDADTAILLELITEIDRTLRALH
ncbi:hypothetical protein GCM10011348_25870 [Marinobacterium nitratireducens]|uniref:YqcC-like domain-containing protein n=1 Tax=Marinobacterium nitratireducens TaxID=518897 RepID=A0A917ZJB7_9GAMM|nr:YqcC family protein [Marinobacterium nitratireducens]GGO83049.1 hypothetical protein GCM10011348_25870 [Marinobacterium nitratireducens]